MINVIDKVYKIKDGIYYSENSNEDKGYWSNISVKDQEEFLSECRTIGTLKSVRENFPNLEGVIYDPTRSVGLRFLNIKP